METQILIIYITAPNEQTAKNIITDLLENQLIACANIIPIESMYYSPRGIENANETLILAKTASHLFVQVKARVMKIHPYQTPCIIGISGLANEAYLEFIDNYT